MKVNHKLKVFFGNKIVYPVIIFILLIDITIFLMIYKYIDFTRQSHVLHYNFYFGIDLLGGGSNLIYIPIVGFMIFLINFLLAFWIYNKKEEFFASYFILFAALFVNIELFMYILGIISIEY